MSAVVPVDDVADVLRGVLVVAGARLGVDGEGRPTMTVPYMGEPRAFVVDSAEGEGYALGAFRVVRGDLKARPHPIAEKVARSVLEDLARRGD